MKNTKWFFPVIVVMFSLFTFTSCDNYDDFNDDFAEEDAGDFDDNFDQDTDTGNNGSNSGTNSGEASIDPDYGVAFYKIDGRNLILSETENSNNAWMNDRNKHEDMFSIVTAMVPENHRQYMTYFEVFDGQEELLGYVYNTTEQLDSWVFGLDIASAYLDGQTLEQSGDFIHTVIHEYGHILSLDASQLNPSESNCNNYNPGEGCAFETSYIDEFHERFWEDIAAEHSQAEAQGDDAIYDFYLKYPDRFVSDYAATNPAEDFAEVFSHFVTHSEIPTGGQIKDQKVRFLNEYPELVDLRNHMRGTNYTLPNPGMWKRPTCRNHSHKATF